MANQPSAEAVALRSREVLGDPAYWFHPGGYPDGLALCVLDSIWSLGVRYEAHVVPVIERYREIRRGQGADPARDGLTELRGAISASGGTEQFADDLNNRQRTSTRRGAPTKAQAVDLAAERLLGIGIDTTADFRRRLEEDEKAVHREWRSIPGQRSSDIGWRYLLLLAGVDGVKPDRMVARFLADCGLPSSSSREAADTVAAAAAQLGVPARVLDHMMWRYESCRSGRR